MWSLFQQWAETASVANILGIVALWVIAIGWAWSAVRSGRDEPVAAVPRLATTALRAQIRRDVRDRHARAVEGRGHQIQADFTEGAGRHVSAAARISPAGDESGYSGTRITMSKPEDAA